MSKMPAETMGDTEHSVQPIVDAVPQLDEEELSQEQRQLLLYARDLADVLTRESRRAHELELLHRELAILSEIGLRLFQATKVDQVLSLARDVLTDELRFEHVSILLFQEGVGFEEFEQFVRTQRRPIRVPVDHWLCRKFVELGTPYVMGRELCGGIETLSPGYWQSGELQSGVVAISLFGRGRVVGMLLARHEQGKDELTAEQLRVLTILGGQLGTALLHAQELEESMADRERLNALTKEQHSQLGSQSRFQDIVGRSRVMENVFRMLQRLTEVETTVMITGETGTGKEVFARALHYNGPRKEGPFVVLNCASIPETLLEAELFGHEKGAFTGAVRNRIGKVEMAEKGTLFLDEIGEMPPALQAKLLRFLETRQFERLGENQVRRADICVISATNVDTAKAVLKGTFRSDLLYRLNVVNIHLPPLRERPEDIPLLVEHFLKKIGVGMNSQVAGFQPPEMGILMGYGWPGNVRELRNFVERVMILATGEHPSRSEVELALYGGGYSAPRSGLLGGPVDVTGPLTFTSNGTTIPMRTGTVVTNPYGAATSEPSSDPSSSSVDVPPGSFMESKRQYIEQFEKAYLESALRKTGGNLAAAAREAGMHKKNLLDKVKRLGIDRSQFRS